MLKMVRMGHSVAVTKPLACQCDWTWAGIERCEMPKGQGFILSQPVKAYRQQHPMDMFTPKAHAVGLTLSLTERRGLGPVWWIQTLSPNPQIANPHFNQDTAHATAF